MTKNPFTPTDDAFPSTVSPDPSESSMDSTSSFESISPPSGTSENIVGYFKNARVMDRTARSHTGDSGGDIESVIADRDSIARPGAHYSSQSPSTTRAEGLFKLGAARNPFLTQSKRAPPDPLPLGTPPSPPQKHKASTGHAPSASFDSEISFLPRISPSVPSPFDVRFSLDSFPSTTSAAEPDTSNNTPPPISEEEQRIIQRIDTIFKGSEVILSHPGSSQYSQGMGASACGLASLNCAKVVFELQREGILGEIMLSELMKQDTMETITEICRRWTVQAHLDVEDVCETPFFRTDLHLRDTRYGRPNVEEFTKLLRELDTDQLQSSVVIITRPPEIIACFKVPTPRDDVYVIFDSHPRPMHSQGAAFTFNNSIAATAERLSRILAVDVALVNDPTMEWQTQLLGNFSGHIFSATRSPLNDIGAVKDLTLELSIEGLAKQAQLDEARREVSELQAERRKLQADLQGMQAQNLALHNQVGELENEVQRIKTRSRSFFSKNHDGERYRDKQRDGDRWRGEIDQPDNKDVIIDSLRMENQRMQQEIETRKQVPMDAHAHEVTITSLQSEMQHLRRVLESVHAVASATPKTTPMLELGLSSTTSPNANGVGAASFAPISFSPPTSAAHASQAASSSKSGSHAHTQSTSTTAPAVPPRHPGPSLDSAPSTDASFTPRNERRQSARRPYMHWLETIANQQQQSQSQGLLSPLSIMGDRSLPTEEPLGEEWEGEWDVHTLDDKVHSHLSKAPPLGKGTGAGASTSTSKSGSLDTRGAFGARPGGSSLRPQDPPARAQGPRLPQRPQNRAATGKAPAATAPNPTSRTTSAPPAKEPSPEERARQEEEDRRLASQLDREWKRDDVAQAVELQRMYDQQEQALRLGVGVGIGIGTLGASSATAFASSSSLQLSAGQLSDSSSGGNGNGSAAAPGVVKKANPFLNYKSRRVDIKGKQPMVAGTSSKMSPSHKSSNGSLRGPGPGPGASSTMKNDDDKPLFPPVHPNSQLSHSRPAHAQQEQPTPTDMLIHHLASQESLATRDRELVERLTQQTFQCGICFDELPLDDVAKVDGCAHMFCRDCLRGYVKSKIGERRFPIMCPSCTAGELGVGAGVGTGVKEGAAGGNKGPGIIHDMLVQTVGIEEVDYAIFTELQMVQFSILVHCRKCERSTFIVKDEHDRVDAIPCPLPGCNYVWCKQCSQEIRGGSKHSCDGSSELNDLMQKQGWKHCPGCKTPALKHSGCNHMTCPVAGCNSHFCYVCGESIIRGGTRRDIDQAIKKHYSRTCQLFQIPPE